VNRLLNLGPARRVPPSRRAFRSLYLKPVSRGNSMSAHADALRPIRQRDLMVMCNPQLWSKWPFLPVIRPSKEGEEPELGVLYDARQVSGTYGYTATVFLCNLFLLPATEAQLFAAPKRVYDTREELVQDGWTID
jgi:hypothetical protein